jgi:hypothetical protein
MYLTISNTVTAGTLFFTQLIQPLNVKNKRTSISDSMTALGGIRVANHELASSEVHDQQRHRSQPGSE